MRVVLSVAANPTSIDSFGGAIPEPLASASLLDSHGMTDPWFPQVRPAPNATLRLFCLPHAGGAASSFRTWRDRLPDAISVWAVQPPGREARFAERVHESVDELVEALLPVLREHLEPLPFAFFGHSLGALVACAVTRRLEGEGGPLPRRLLVSGSRAPHVAGVRPPLHALSDEAFLAGMAELDGMPREVLASRELMELLLPLLRAEMRMSEQYLLPLGAPLGVPISAFGGTQDPEVPVESLLAWREVTRGEFRSRLFPGGHFYLRSEEASLLAAIREELSGASANP